MKESNPMVQLCNAKTRQGQNTHCRKPAGWGTDHQGTGRCRLHGGNSPGGRAQGARQAAEIELRSRGLVMGPAVDIDPHEALLSCIRIAAGEVAYSTMKIEELEEADAIGSPVTQSDTTGGEFGDSSTTIYHPVELNIWIKVRHASMERLAKWAKMAIDAGVEERRVRLAESHGEQLSKALEAMFAELDLTPTQRALLPDSMRRHLLTLESKGSVMG